MKLKIISLILIMFLIPGALVLTACKKEEGYNLKSLSTDFYSIAETENDNIVKINNAIRFDFSNHVYNNKAYLQEAVNSTAPYTALKEYNEMFQNMMAFSYAHIGLCSNAEVELNASVRNNLKQELDNLHKAMKGVNTGINLLAEGLKLSQDPTNDICVERYKNLLLKYEEMFQKASQFTGYIANVYYKNILVNSNPDVTAVGVHNFDVNTVVKNFRSRLLFQISNLTHLYVEKNICGGTLAQDLANSTTSLNLTNYKNKINSIKLADSLTEEQMAEKANNEINKENFYNLAIKAFNLQEILSGDASKFAIATRDIDYIKIVGDINKSSNHEKMCVEIIDGYQFVLEEYNKVLTDMVAVLAS